ncbi:DNA polymerase III subunit beta [Phaeovibrio sulfidiphilus]|uniref:Beta sliding clamp n=1 Tax=Phaeovibrio sulfidiphilus TaxID=1220600 RepID=A0A8J7CBS7_9PROT|nr:DNA polymerase III subunit beta [Phaeovibrio sulfidiphilus]MBE1236498.1 DNA polymerase III subunit beta [Phaeovibrio sulfidiphilus]
MKFTTERTAFLKSLGHVQSIVEKRGTIPILSNVRLEAKGEGLSLNATDMDIEIEEFCPAGVIQPGATTAPAHTLFEIVRKLPDGAQVEVSFDGDESQILLRAGRSRFRLACLPVSEFPIMNPGEFSHTFAIPASDLRGLIDRTRQAISNEETRYYLNGIFLHAADSGGVPVLRAVATDGHRLACADVPLPQGAAGMPGIILPKKTVGELRKLSDETGMDISIAVSEQKIRFTFDDISLVSKLIDGKFPDYERVIPRNNDKMLQIDRQSFSQAVDRVSAISSERSKAVKMALGKDQISLSANSPDAGSAQEDVSAEYDSQAFEIGFNARYLTDILDHLQGETVQISLSDGAAPTVIRDTADASALYVLMPMRV